MQNNGYYFVQGHRGRYQSKARKRLPISEQLIYRDYLFLFPDM